MDDCIFCKIARHEIPSTVVYEDETVIAFEDTNPQVPVHTLIIPKEHYASIASNVPESLLGHIIAVSARVAEIKGVDKTGYRLTTNVGDDGRQTVMHLHVHILGGAQMPIRMGPAD
ncbi:MAG: histidine triad nucleotide-binding protein [Coriobacteriia bacterium]|nr:histidine triad nucleotide-binding protein [Coriobacteriia bacterium]